MESLITELDNCNFLHRWFDIEEYHLYAYIRITKRFIDGVFHDTLEIANVKVVEEYRDCGYFSMFLGEIERLGFTYDRIIYIESIINPILKNYISKLDYIEDPRNENSFYKMI